MALTDELERTVIAVNNRFLNPSNLILSRSKETERLTKTPIQDWVADDIKEWSTAIRKQPITTNALPEILAVIKQAVKCSEGFLPRDIQLLSVLSLLLKGNAQGRLAQIYTGEGKTTTISMIAVVLVLQQRKVDIVTSSEVLARRDANDKATFYNLFGISVAENCSDLRMGPKRCYKADVVYGDTLNFQGDILCDEYQQLNTRCKRPFDMVIVDEVDSMLIDERLRMTRLSSFIPGMSALTPALEVIWRAVCRIHRSLTHGHGLTFGDLDPAVLVTLHLKEELEQIKAEIEEKIPEYLREYVLNQAMTWCFNAAHALLTYQENVHYVKRDGQIIPVDYKSTGTFQHRMHWGEGLHQFLQMKHDLPVDPINLTTNFLSNVTFFQRYRTNIVGLTGTLGSQSEQALLQNLYTLDSVHIPSYKLRKLQETPGKILRESKSWLEAIKASIIAETTKGRAVLVVCETIQKVNAIQDTLTDYDQTLVHPYIENTEEEQALIHGELQPRQIIIATNLAGRGTDLKISSELEQNGGLHVIVAFLPENKRVEDQAFGRAGRQGSPGTAQLIININDETTRLTYSKYKNIDEIKAARDAKEKRLLDLAAKETQKVVNKDKLFTEFCQLMHVIKKESQNHKEILDALEERWGFWLFALTDAHLLTDKHQELFLKFKEDILRDYKAGEIIKNPKYYLRHGHKKFEAQQYEEALRLYTTAFEMNQLDGYPVYYQALALIKLQEQSKDPTQLTEAVKLLDEAIRLCGDDLGLYKGIRKRYQKPQLTKRENEAGTTEDADVKIQHLPLLQRTSNEDSSTQLQLDQALQPIESKDISATNCSRYDDLILVRNNIMEEIIKLSIEAKQALETGNVLKINIQAMTQLYNSTSSKPIAKTLEADGFPSVALPVGKEISLFPVFFTGTLGIMELVTGIALCATGVGIIWGYGLTIEGTGDLFILAQKL